MCLQAAQELRQRYSHLGEQPIVLELGNVGQVSVLGPAPLRRHLATNLLLQAVALHSPNDLSVALVRSDAAASAWDWVKWLPHVQDAQLLDGELPARG